MLEAYLESHLYSDLDYAIIAVSRPSGTDQCLLESVRRGTIKRERSHDETTSSCSVWIWYRWSVAGRGTAYTASMVTKRFWLGRLHRRGRHGPPWLDIP